MWVREGSLKESFPQVCAITLQEEACVAQVWSPQGWDLIFRRALNDGEVARLLEVLHKHPGLSLRADSMRWKIQAKGVFTVKSCYWKHNTLRHITDKWPWKLNWKTRSPPKTACFTWLVCRNACLTPEVLQKKGMAD